MVRRSSLKGSGRPLLDMSGTLQESCVASGNVSNGNFQVGQEHCPRFPAGSPRDSSTVPDTARVDKET
jgi:hypothetical protein